MKRYLFALALVIAFGLTCIPTSAQTQVWHWVNGVLTGPTIKVDSVLAGDGTFATSLVTGVYVIGTEGRISAPAGDGIIRLSNFGGTDFSRLQFGGTTSAFPSLKRSGSSIQARVADDSNFAPFLARYLYSDNAAITVGAGTGITVVDPGVLQRQVYKVTIDRTAFVCAATTCDVTIATLPARTNLVTVYGEIGTTFACSATCTSSTLSMMLGKGSGGAEYLAAGADLDAAATTFGDTDAEMGTLMTRAAAIQGGTYTAVTQNIVMRLTSGTGNIGNGSATNLSQGTITFRIVTEVMP